MKNILNALVVLSTLSVTTTSFAQSSAPNSANYKQQNQLLGRKNTSNAPAKVQLNNAYSTNPHANNRNYKAKTKNNQKSNIVVAVNNDDIQRNYKQKNLLTNKGREVNRKTKHKLDSTQVIGE
ncbi:MULTISPECIES: hypothetical protein [Emticicia]|uniref:hypothetical protein n=1 Tax=Emticicia TaxID=312278 RepID=UPI0007D8C4D4|nr:MULTISPECIES: hypothetical protein [Emticicia]